MNNTCVIKFGGSSLANSDKIKFAAYKIKSFKKTYKNIICVLSAPNNITDDLIKLENSFSKTTATAHQMLVATGEIISISLMEIALNSIKVKAKALNQYQAKIITNSKYNDANIIYISKEEITKYINKGYVTILPGFIGINKDMEITTLGRGGSDYTAVYLSNIFNADCYFLSDVKGVYSSNPSKIEQAIKLNEISYTELNEISKIDFSIRQTKALLYAMKNNLNLYLGSVFDNTKPTLIHKYPKDHKPEIKYITFDRKDKSIIVQMIGENIGKNNNIINYIKKSRFKKININKHRIELTLLKTNKKDVTDIYKRFIFKT